jgi:ketosteroid isomerase-like protein
MKILLPALPTALALLLGACATTPETSAPSEEASSETTIVTQMGDERTLRLKGALDAFAANDMSYGEDLMSPDLKIWLPDGSEPLGNEAWAEFTALTHKAFKDVQFTNLAMNTTEYPQYGAWTYAWCVYQVTSRATGEVMRFPLHIMWNWDGDKIVRDFRYGDVSRYMEAMQTTLARLEGGSAPSPWEWTLGRWRVTGGDMPDAVVQWTKVGPDVDAVVGSWIDATGVQTRELVDWDPTMGQLTSTAASSDGGLGRVVLTDFPDGRHMNGTFHMHTADGSVLQGAAEIAREADDRMVLRLLDASGQTVERVFTPAADDEPMFLDLAPVTSGGDWRTKATDAVHASYVAGDFDAGLAAFADDCIHQWGDPNGSVTNADWKAGLAVHHEVFSDISLENYYSMTGEYSDGNVWTASWFTWTGTDRKTGEKAEFLVHCAWRWEGDKIVEDKTFFDVERFVGLIEAAQEG